MGRSIASVTLPKATMVTRGNAGAALGIATGDVMTHGDVLMTMMMMMMMTMLLPLPLGSSPAWRSHWTRGWGAWSGERP